MSDLLNDGGAWLIPDLSIAAELQQEVDRRKAAHLSRDALAALTDKLICDWYKQTDIINRLLGRVRCLEVELALSLAQPSDPEPSAEHYLWAKELRNDAAKRQGHDAI